MEIDIAFKTMSAGTTKSFPFQKKVVADLTFQNETFLRGKVVSTLNGAYKSWTEEQPLKGALVLPEFTSNDIDKDNDIDNDKDRGFVAHKLWESGNIKSEVWSKPKDR